jgi:hypothetical protein
LFQAGEIHQAAEMMEAKSLSVADQRRDQRRTILERTATLGLDPDSALNELEAMRWADRLAYHIWRVTHHLREDQPRDGLNIGEMDGKKVKAKDKNKKKKKKDKKEKKAKELSEEGLVQPYTAREKN